MACSKACTPCPSRLLVVVASHLHRVAICYPVGVASLQQAHDSRARSRLTVLASGVQVFCDNYLDGGELCRAAAADGHVRRAGVQALMPPDAGLHVPFAHPRLAADLDLRGYTHHLFERVSVQSAPPRPDSASSERLGAPLQSLPGLTVMV